MTRVALDLLGGDHAPDSVVEGALLATARATDLHVILVGPPELAETLLAGRGDPAVTVSPATQLVGMNEDPALGVRAKRDATVRVCARLVRDGAADAMVSVGSTGAALAAALLTLGRLPGVTRPALALIVPAAAGPLVLLDAGANPEAGPDLLAQFALAGAAYATVALGLSAPRVGLLNNGQEEHKGDELRRQAFTLLQALPVDFIGNVEGRDVALGGPADVVVTDGFTGNVLLKGMEGAIRLVGDLVLSALTSTAGRTAAATELLPVLAEATSGLRPEAQGGAVLLGVKGVVVVGHGSSSPQAVASCVEQAAAAARDGIVAGVGSALAGLVAARRAPAELESAP